MRYQVRKSVIWAIGPIWWPVGAMAAQTYELSGYDIENMRDDDGKITRDSVDRWLAMNAGDFQHVADFRASIEDGDSTVDIEWADEESELTFGDCMRGPDED